MFGFYHTHGSSGNQCFLTSKFSGRPSEGSFENVLWRKVKQMQPMWLCLLTLENTQCRKIKQMQPMWRCNMHPLWQAISGDIWKHTVEKSQTNVTKWLCILTDTQFEYTDKNTQWRKAKINVTLPHLRQAWGWQTNRSGGEIGWTHTSIYGKEIERLYWWATSTLICRERRPAARRECSRTPRRKSSRRAGGSWWQRKHSNRSPAKCKERMLSLIHISEPTRPY